MGAPQLVISPRILTRPLDDGIIPLVMKSKLALFAFNGDPMCFVHVLLNAVDSSEKGIEVALIIEGGATGLLKDMVKPTHQFHDLYEKVKKLGLIDCVCRACSHKMGSLESAKDQDLPLCDELSGHPAMSRYIERGYTIISF